MHTAMPVVLVSMRKLRCSYAVPESASIAGCIPENIAATCCTLQDMLGRVSDYDYTKLGEESKILKWSAVFPTESSIIQRHIIWDIFPLLSDEALGWL